MRIIILILMFLTTVGANADEMAITQGLAVTDTENSYECVDRYRTSTARAT